MIVVAVRGRRCVPVVVMPMGRRRVSVIIVAVRVSRCVTVIVVPVCGGRCMPVVVVAVGRSGVSVIIVTVTRVMTVIVARLMLVAHCDSIPQPLFAVIAAKSV